MGAQTESMVLLALLFSLTASSFCIAWIVNDYAESPPCLFGQTCAPIQLAWDTTSGIPNLYNQDYTNTSGYDANLTFSQDDWLVDYGEWTQGPNGYELTALPGGLFSSTALMLLDGILPQQGHYIVNYGINNVPNGDFAVYPRISGVDDQMSTYTIKVKFSSDGIHVRNLLTNFEDSALGDSHPDIYFYPMGGSQTTLDGGSVITTDYSPSSDTLSVFKDGIMLFGVSGVGGGLNIDNLAGKFYYGGVSAYDEGFLLQGTSATRASTTQPGGFSSLWSGLVAEVAGFIPGAAQVLQMITLMASVLAWQLPQEIFPLWLSALLIAPQELAIVYLLARLARGGG